MCSKNTSFFIYCHHFDIILEKKRHEGEQYPDANVFMIENHRLRDTGKYFIGIRPCRKNFDWDYFDTDIISNKVFPSDFEFNFWTQSCMAMSENGKDYETRGCVVSWLPSMTFHLLRVSVNLKNYDFIILLESLHFFDTFLLICICIQTHIDQSVKLILFRIVNVRHMLGSLTPILSNSIICWLMNEIKAISKNSDDQVSKSFVLCFSW